MIEDSENVELRSGRRGTQAHHHNVRTIDSCVRAAQHEVSRLEQYLIQSTLLERLIGVRCGPITPAVNLLDGDAMGGGRFTDLDLQLGSRCDCVGPATLLER